MPFLNVDQISEWLDGTGITLLELHGPMGSIRLEDRPAADAPKAPADIIVTSSGTGTFRDRHPLSAAVLVAPGMTVAECQIIGLLQIGALLTPVLAPCAATVAGLLVAEGEIVGFGTKLIALHPLTSQAAS